MNTVAKILLAQTLLSVALAVVFGSAMGRTAAISVLLGGALCVLPNAFLARRLLSKKAVSSPRRALRAAWLGEIGKLVITAVLFAAVFIHVRPLNPALLFLSFITAQGIVLLALITENSSWA